MAEDDDHYTRSLLRKSRRALQIKSNVSVVIPKNAGSSSESSNNEGEDDEEFDFEDDYDDNSIGMPEGMSEVQLSQSILIADET